MLDIVIRGGTVIDGTGTPGRKADVGIRGDRIVAIGEISEEATQEIDASGKVVAPGFIDVHTHYDAQAFWDGTLSPSPFHGVTTVFAGNCGFSIAPLTPDAGAYLMRMLARVEGMPLESLEAGVPWDWRSFGEYLGKLDGKLAVNAGFMVGHSALRRVVMGERAVGEEATPEELEAMKQLLGTSMAEGGMGFSTTISPTHNDGEGQPVPSRHASREELVELARVCSQHEGTTVEFLPGIGPHTDEGRELMIDVSLASRRSVNWNVMAPSADNREMIAQQLETTTLARERGAEIIALTVPQPMTVRINLFSGFVFDALADWPKFFKLSIEERIEKLKDPEYRTWLDDRAHSPESGIMAGVARWEMMKVDQVESEANQPYLGRIVGDIAKEQGKEPFDMFCEIAIADGLKTSFMPPNSGDDDASWVHRGDTWVDDRTVIGASDAGAHLDMIDTFAVPTQVLGNGVRKRGVIGLEEAIRQLTDVPAKLYGLRERGRLEEGLFADVVVFDPNTVDTGPTYTKQDLPAGAGRLYADAIGIEHVIVNGAEIIRGAEHTGAFPGTVLRSGRDTYTVPIPGDR
jgi:N-acyl-D-aspartate/D-glutamate deacylase